MKPSVLPPGVPRGLVEAPQVNLAVRRSLATPVARGFAFGEKLASAMASTAPAVALAKVGLTVVHARQDSPKRGESLARMPRAEQPANTIAKAPEVRVMHATSERPQAPTQLFARAEQEPKVEPMTTLQTRVATPFAQAGALVERGAELREPELPRFVVPRPRKTTPPPTAACQPHATPLVAEIASPTGLTEAAPATEAVFATIAPAPSAEAALANPPSSAMAPETVTVREAEHAPDQQGGLLMPSSSTLPFAPLLAVEPRPPTVFAHPAENVMPQSAVRATTMPSRGPPSVRHLGGAIAPKLAGTAPHRPPAPVGLPPSAASAPAPNPLPGSDSAVGPAAQATPTPPTVAPAGLLTLAPFTAETAQLPRVGLAVPPAPTHAPFFASPAQPGRTAHVARAPHRALPAPVHQASTALAAADNLQPLVAPPGPSTGRRAADVFAPSNANWAVVAEVVAEALASAPDPLAPVASHVSKTTAKPATTRDHAASAAPRDVMASAPQASPPLQPNVLQHALPSRSPLAPPLQDAASAGKPTAQLPNQTLGEPRVGLAPEAHKPARSNMTSLPGPSNSGNVAFTAPTVASPMPQASAIPAAATRLSEPASSPARFTPMTSPELLDLGHLGNTKIDVTNNEARVSVDTEAGALSLHVRVRQGVADVTLDGHAAAQLGAHGRDLEAYLSKEGLTLGRFNVDDRWRDGGTASGDTEDRDSSRHGADEGDGTGHADNPSVRPISGDPVRVRTNHRVHVKA